MHRNIERRITKLRDLLRENGIDTLLVLNPYNRNYLSGFTGEDPHFQESAGALVIGHSQLIFATDGRYLLQAQRDALGYDVFRYKKGLANELPEILKGTGTKKLGFELNYLTYSQYHGILKQIRANSLGIELVETYHLVEHLRMFKDDSEIKNTKRAISIAEAAFESILGSIGAGIAENEAAWSIETRMRELNSDPLSFPVVVASGPNSALPKARTKERKLRKGEPVIVNWGARVKGYCSHISRTLVIGKADDIFEKAYQIVSEAQQKAIEAIRPGINTRVIYNIIREHIDNTEFKGKYGETFGHGTGLSINELPIFDSSTNIILEEGMLFTIEPGIYLPQWGGIRLENQVVVRKGGAEVLNAIDRLAFCI